MQDANIQLQREIFRLEGKSAQEIEELLKELIHHKGFKQESDDKQQSFSIANIVFNYFGSSQDTAASSPEAKEKQEQLTKLR